MGVELGKQLATAVSPYIGKSDLPLEQQKQGDFDDSTLGLIDRVNHQ
jgi:hypothetical protein